MCVHRPLIEIIVVSHSIRHFTWHDYITAIKHHPLDAMFSIAEHYRIEWKQLSMQERILDVELCAHICRYVFRKWMSLLMNMAYSIQRCKKCRYRLLIHAVWVCHASVLRPTSLSHSSFLSLFVFKQKKLLIICWISHGKAFISTTLEKLCSVSVRWSVRSRSIASQDTTK